MYILSIIQASLSVSLSNLFCFLTGPFLVLLYEDDERDACRNRRGQRCELREQVWSEICQTSLEAQHDLRPEISAAKPLRSLLG